MIPSFENTDDLLLGAVEEKQENTQTFGLNMNLNFISGKVDGLDALKQSIYFRLSTEADQYLIYPYTYGLNTLDLIGKPSYYVAAVLPERIKNALLGDDRITDVTDFEFKINRNKITVKFIVHTIYGEVDGETEVAY